MQTIYFKGIPCHTFGCMPRIRSTAPCFSLVTSDLKEIRCADFKGKTTILTTFPSLDTDVCATSVRHFNEQATEIPDTSVICVSMDLPFAQQRFCAAHGIKNVIVASAFRSPLFSEKYGIQIIDGPLTGLLARTVTIIDKDFHVAYVEMVEEITNEPDYKAIISFLKHHDQNA